MQLVAFKQYGVQLDATKIRKRHLRTLGFNVVNDVFADNSWYFRNALVRANYSDLTQGITETTIYLVNFFRSMLLGEEHDLRNRTMHIEWKRRKILLKFKEQMRAIPLAPLRQTTSIEIRTQWTGGSKAGGRGSKAGFIRNLTMGRCNHHCYIVTCYIKDFTSISRSSATS